MLPPLQSPMPARYPTAHGQRYLLPCPLLGLGGLYEYVLVDVAQARRWLESGPYRSWISHPLLRLALDRVVGIATARPVRGPWPVLGYQDDALVFTVEGYETLPQQLTGCSVRLSQLVAEERYTLGLLRKLA